MIVKRRHGVFRELKTNIMQIANNIHAEFFKTNGRDPQEFIDVLIKKDYITGEDSECGNNIGELITDKGDRHEAYNECCREINIVMGLYHFLRLDVVGEYWGEEDPNNAIFGCDNCGCLMDIKEATSRTWTDKERLTPDEETILSATLYCSNCNNTQHY